MNEEEFWSIIAASRKGVRKGEGAFDKQVEKLRKLLRSKSATEIQEFDHLFVRFLKRAYVRDLWAAAYVLGEGCSDDGFSDFRVWLVSMGKETYENALRDPDSLVSVLSDPAIEDFFFMEFSHVSYEVLEEMGTEVKRAVEPYPELSGPEWTEDDLPRMLPRLWAECGWELEDPDADS